MTTQSYSVLAVGEPSPFPSPGVGVSAIAATINGGILTLVVQLPSVSPDDLRAITGDPFALALHQTDLNPIGTMMVALRGDGEDTWPLKAPILDAAAVMEDWAQHPQETNVLLIALIDSTSNEIRSLRTIGLPTDFLELVRKGILAARAIDRSAIMMYAARLGVEQVWKEGIQWINDPATDTFKRN